MVVPPPEDHAAGDVAAQRPTYWDEYYGNRAEPSRSRRPLPSQFAAFVAGELRDRHRVVEFGCGDGRDSLFFASYGHDVIGLDGSKAGVEAAQTLCDTFETPARFLQADVSDASVVDQLGSSDVATCVYARFFIHAITDAEEQQFLALVASMTSSGDRLAVEYRTVRDQSGSKVTAAHYRRFVPPWQFQARAQALGFEVAYAVEGYGFAKYRDDDAYVARTVMVRS